MRDILRERSQRMQPFRNEARVLGTWEVAIRDRLWETPNQATRVHRAIILIIVKSPKRELPGFQKVGHCGAPGSHV